MRTICLICTCTFAMFVAAQATAQAFPNRALTLVVNSIAGGPPDTVARAMKDEIGAALGQPVVVENRAGAGGMPGAASVAKAEPNGYTFLLSSAGAVTIAPVLYANAGFDPLNDFEYINLAADGPVVFAFTNGVPASTMQEFIAYAKREPGKLNYGTGGIGTPSHLASEMLQAMTGIKMVHVPYRGSPQAVAALLVGDVTLFVSSAPTVVPLAAAGKIKLLAVSGAKRMRIAPDVPTTAEVGLADLSAPAWFGFFAPKGTPRAIVDRLDAAVRTAIANPVVQDRLDKGAYFTVGTGSEAFARYHRTELERWRKIMRDANIKGE